MKQFLSILLVVLALALLSHSTTFAAVNCQVVYGGGEICQGQKPTTNTYPPTPTPNQTSDQTQNQTSVPTTTSLPSTGTSALSIGILSVAGIAGIILLLL